MPPCAPPLESSTVAARCILAACRRSIDPVSSSSSPSSNASIVTDVRESSTLAARGLRGAGARAGGAELPTRAVEGLGLVSSLLVARPT